MNLPVTTILLMLSLSSYSALLPAQADQAATGSREQVLSEAQKRWNQMSPVQQRKILDVHAALQKLPAGQRKQLIERVRELDPAQSSTVIRQIDQFLKSPSDQQKKLRRRGFAYRLWRWNLDETQREHFRKLAPSERGEFLRAAIREKEKSLLAKLPEQERVKLLQLPNHKRWEALDLRNNKRRPPDSPRIGRVLHLVHRLDRAQMRQFIQTGQAPAGYPALERAVSSLSEQEANWISTELRRGVKRKPPHREFRGDRDPRPGARNTDRPPRREGQGGRPRNNHPRSQKRSGGPLQDLHPRSPEVEVLSPAETLERGHRDDLGTDSVLRRGQIYLPDHRA